MAGMGPPPKHPTQRRRRNASVSMTKLPAAGRKGRAPKFPIPLAVVHDDATRTKMVRRLEAEMWTELWKTPQAVAWEALGYYREVAQYVRWKVLGELGNLDAAKEARQLSDRLGLTPLSMLRLRWEVDQRDEVGDARERRETPAPPRRRLKVADPALSG